MAYRGAEADPSRLHTGVAVDCAARAAKRFGISEMAFRASVTGVRVREQRWARALHVVVSDSDSVRHEVRFEPASASSLASGLGEPASFDAPNVSLPGELIEDKAALLSTLPPELHPVLAAGERLESTRIQSFVSTLLRVEYEVGQGRGFIDVAAHDSSVLSSSDFAPLASRRWLLLVGGGVAASVAALAFVAFLSLRPWASEPSRILLVLALGALLTAGVVVAPQELTLTAAARHGQRGLAALGLALASLGLLAFGWLGTRPSADHATAALLAGRDADAELEARALLAGDEDTTRAKVILDDVHLRRVKSARDLAEKARLASLDWYSPSVRATGQSALRQSTIAAADAAYAKGSRSELERMADARVLDSDSREYALALRALLDVRECDARGDVDCTLRVLAKRLPAAGQVRVSPAETLLERELKRVLYSELQRRVDADSKEERRKSWARAIWLTHQLRLLGVSNLVPSLDELEVGYQQALYTAQGEAAQREKRESFEQRERDNEAQRAERAHQAAAQSLKEWETEVLGKGK